MRWPILILAMLLLSACAGDKSEAQKAREEALITVPHTSIGRPFAQQRLGELAVGVSSEKEVVATLGPPTGKGRWRWPGEPRPIELRVYDFTYIQEKDIELNSLVVFLKNGTHLGHYWFNANATLRVEINPQ